MPERLLVGFDAKQDGRCGVAVISDFVGGSMDGSVVA